MEQKENEQQTIKNRTIKMMGEVNKDLLRTLSPCVSRTGDLKCTLFLVLEHFPAFKIQ